MTPVLIPIINGRELSRACIKSVLAQDVPCEVVILDNGSTDGSAEMLRAWADDRVTYIAARKPSVAASWNFGLKWLFGKGHEVVAVLNNDLEILPCTIRELLAENAPFVTAVSVGTRDQFKEGPRSDDRRPRPDFSCYAIRKSCYETVGPFDENCEVAFFEDNLYHVSMHRKGIRAYCIDVPFLHHGSQTIKNSDPEDVRRIAGAAAKNKEYFRFKWGCYPATPEYDELFSESSFGVEA